MPKKIKKREIRKKIIEALWFDGEMTPNQIAEEYKLPYKSVLKEYKEMIDTGVIRKVGVVNPKELDKKITAFMFLSCHLGREITRADRDRIALELKKIDEIEEVHYVVGEYDFLIKFRISNMEEYDELTTQKILPIQGILRASGWIVAKTFKEVAKYEIRD